MIYDDLDYLNINLDDTSTILDDAENSIQRKLGKKKDKVWDYFNVIDIPNNPHKGATCKYCSQSWKRGKPIEMKSHLALRCPKVTHSVKMEYLYAMSSEDIPKQSTNNRKNNSNEIDIAKVNKTLIRFFVCCGIPFSVVDSPFFQDFVKSLCFEYELPKRTALSTTYLNEEAANILLKIEEELHESRNLTLGQSIYAFIIITPNRRQYIYSIEDFSSQRYTAEFNEKQLLKVIEDVGKDKFIAVVSDGEAAIQSAKRRILSEQPDIFVNAVKTKAIIQNRQFWHDVEQLKMILGPAKNAVKALELNTTTLADCFIELLKMAQAISAISFQNHDFKQKCIAIFNKRWKEFDINIYMLAFFLHPKYRATCFQQNIFKSVIMREAINIWKNQCGGGKESSNYLLIQLGIYRNKEPPFDDPYVVDCERVFSILGWFLSKRRTKINIKRLQAMAQMHSYLIMNAKSELKYINDEITLEELDQTLNQVALSINNGIDLFEMKMMKILLILKILMRLKKL
ncbi:hypothetical protein RclHR1_04250003 [Rhizophagus clarus]|uniref:BED-type domain-containing protein n=1 Tax=Rhizophagus clarus TaxID=94130 RepID=A0A2Z6SA71_9GLOM|nr:hypothetical protein RclHR1_04250003 [Rhizophagus clarus]